MAEFPILYQDSNLVVIDKPSGFHVHPPETRAEKVPRHKIILHQLRNQIGTRVYPLHRLDVSTSGLLAFALSSEAASFYGKLFQQRGIEKKYWAVVRGFPPLSGQIDVPLESDSSDLWVEALTVYQTLKRIEIPEAVGNKHATARYSWMEVSPKTGRFHQIRRHFNRISHPLIGDAAHGDSRHNRFFREKLGISGLCLRAVELQIPTADSQLTLKCGLDPKWNQIHYLFELAHLSVDLK